MAGGSDIRRSATSAEVDARAPLNVGDHRPDGSLIDRRLVDTAGVFVGALAVAIAIAVLNGVWFDVVNGMVEATGTVARGLLYSSWLILIAVPVVVRRPRAFGIRVGQVPEHLALVTGVVGAATAGTVLLLQLIGSTPYSDASFFIEVFDVPITEELVFRAVMLTVLLVVLRRLWPAATAAALAIAFDAIAFGTAHLANLTAVPTPFTLGQAAFATVLGGLCAFLMVRTKSVYPAIALHAAVNAAVVLS
jgi:membrane protease YdiL (CAAX protease family)